MPVFDVLQYADDRQGNRARYAKQDKDSELSRLGGAISLQIRATIPPSPFWQPDFPIRDISRAHHIMFFFFSNKLGCLGSVVVSILLTLLLLALFGVF